MLSIIQKSLLNSFTYSEYRNRITTLFKEGKVTGNDQSEANLNYTKLNEARMNRLQKTISITLENLKKLDDLTREYIWLVISEGWCGDSAQVVPVIEKLAEGTNNIELRLVFRDENDDLMNLFLTNGTRSVPKLIVLDKNTLEVLGDFGPRPKGGNQFMADYKAKYGFIDKNAKAELQMWYFNDKGMSIQNEIMELMGGLE